MPSSSCIRVAHAAVVSVLAATSASSQSPVLPLPLPATTGGGDQYDLTSGDFDGDGVDELVLAHQTNSVHVLWTDSNARVASKTILPTAVAVDTVSVGDVDGDGDQDIVAVEWSNGTTFGRAIDVWLGDGAGNFTALPPQVGGNGDPWEVLLGDGTGDGKLDLFWGGASIFAGDGAGHFTQLSSFAYYGNGNGNALGDFDEDGVTDIAVSSSSVDSTITARISNGDGTFATSATLSFGGKCYDVEAFDMNGDGHLDLVGTIDSTSKQLGIAYGDGTGHFPTTLTLVADLEPQELEVADLDGDGTFEIVCTNLGSPLTGVFEFTGTSVRRVATVAAPIFAARPTLADFDGDGDRDFAAMDLHEDGVYLARQIGPRVFESPEFFGLQPTQFVDLAVGDLDGDGLDEIVGADAKNKGPVVIRPLPNGGFIGPKMYTSSIDPAAVELGDVNEDGKLDAVLAHELTFRLGVMLGDGQGNLGAAALTVLPGPGIDLALGDWNGDHHLDAACAHYSPNGFSLFLGNGAGGFTLATTVPASGLVSALVAGDFDGDSKLDVVLAGAASLGTTLYPGDGAGGFGTPVALPSVGDVEHAAAGDFDGDGKRDIVLSRTTGAKFEIVYSDGAGAFTALPFAGFVGTPGVLAVRDVDGDGDDDVFTFDTAKRLYYELVLGDPSRAPTLGGSWISGVLSAGAIAVGRFDGDALFDVAAGSDTTPMGIAVSHTTALGGGPTLYCAAKKNSLLCVPQLGFSGTPSASAPSGFTIEAHDVLSNKFGLFYYSLVGPNAVPFLGGTYCVKPPTKRTPLQNAGGHPPPVDCSGVYSFDFNAWMAAGHDANLGAGTTAWGQFWSRDTGFAAPNNVGLTSGIRFTILP